MTILATEESRQYAGTLSLGSTSRAVSIDTTSASTTITADAGSFTSADVDATVTATGVPAGATIVTVTSDTEAVLSAAATATAVDVAATIAGRNRFEKQVYECTLEPAVESKGDELTMLNGNVLDADEAIKWTLKIGMVQDFMDPQGFLEFCRAHALEVVEFDWTPNSELDSPDISGNLKVRPGRYGGATKLRLTSEIEFPVIGEPDVVHPA